MTLESILNEFENQLFNFANDYKPTKLYSSTDLVYNIFLDLQSFG